MLETIAVIRVQGHEAAIMATFPQQNQQAPMNFTFSHFIQLHPAGQHVWFKVQKVNKSIDLKSLSCILIQTIPIDYQYLFVALL